MREIIKHYGYAGPQSELGSSKGRLIAGHTVGGLAQNVHDPLAPGNVVNACGRGCHCSA